MGAIVPIPQIPLSIRPATLEDVPFIDRLQNQHRNQVGFLAKSWIENKIAAGHVLVAEETRRQGEGGTRGEGEASPCPSVSLSPCLPTVTPLGYIISQDRYLKREELGLVVQLNVVPGNQRKLIGATLLKAAFDRAAYGCRLFCCWCAQDIEANRFWESMGFVPLAYRAGSEKRRRVHIFWQKRVRAGDVSTPWWFPCQTNAGAMNADRLVLPIPPGVHWSEEMPVVPGMREISKQEIAEGAERKRIRSSSVLSATARGQSLVPLASCSKSSVKPQAITRSSGLHFAPAAPIAAEAKPPEKKPREKRPKATCPVFDPDAQTRRERSRRKNDPKLLAAARELRDRWLENLNSENAGLIGAGKYDVSRELPDVPASMARLGVRKRPLLAA